MWPSYVVPLNPVALRILSSLSISVPFPKTWEQMGALPEWKYDIAGGHAVCYISDMKLLFRWILNAVALFAVAWVMEDHGVVLTGFGAALKAALFLGFINALIRPLVILLSLPINLLTLGLFTLFINAAFFNFTAWFIDGFEVNGLWAALLGALLLSFFSAILSAGIKK